MLPAKDKQVIELAIVGINYSITRLQKRISKAAQYLDEIQKGLPTQCKKSPVELYGVILEKQNKIKELEDLKFELEIQLTELETQLTE